MGGTHRLDFWYGGDFLIGCSLADAGRLTLRIYAMLECPVRNTICGNEVRMVHREDGRLSVRSVKLFAGMNPMGCGIPSSTC